MALFTRKLKNILWNIFQENTEIDQEFIIENHKLEIQDFLADEWTNISEVDKWGWTPIHRAIDTQNIELVKLVINKSNGADLNFTNLDRQTPLTYAITLGNSDIIELILKNGADPNLKDQLGCTPVCKAIQLGKLEVVKILKHYRADLDRSDKEYTPIMSAILENQLDILNYLIANGANVNLTDDDGYSALKIAIDMGNIDVLGFSLKMVQVKMCM